MSGDWLAMGAIGALVVAGAVRRRGSRGAPLLRLVPEVWEQTDEQLLGWSSMSAPVIFDPQDTGTPVPQGANWGQLVVRTCPFGHSRQSCACELREGYWTDESWGVGRRGER